MTKNINFPKAVALELTYKCNHKCLFCSCPWYNPHSKYVIEEELSTQEWKSAIAKLYELGVEYFSISGGEALMKEGLPEIIEYIRKEGDKRNLHNPIVLISNARIMSEKYLEIFKKNDVHLSMSLPGYKTFAKLTGVNNANGVLHWFSMAKDFGIKTTLNVTVTALNYSELFETISMGMISGANSLLLNRFLPGGRGLMNMDILQIDIEQITGMLKTAEEVLEYSNRYGSVGTEIPMCILGKNKYSRLNIGYRCAAAKDFFVIDPSGRIRTCNHSSRIVGNIFSLPMITDTDYWLTFEKSRYIPSACFRCNAACDCGCREVASILKGRIDDIDPSIGEVTPIE